MTTTPHTPLTDADFAALVAATEGHDPGPWNESEVGDYADFDGESCVVATDDMRIAAVHARVDECANARLIAAAPTLLAEVMHHRSANAALEREVERLREVATREWRTFPDTLPEVDDTVLVLHDSGTKGIPDVAVYRGLEPDDATAHRFIHSDINLAHKLVTHWQPMPDYPDLNPNPET